MRRSWGLLVSQRARIATLSAVAVLLAVYALLALRQPKIRLQVETYAGDVGVRRVLYVVPAREWADSLTGPCALGQMKRDSIVLEMVRLTRQVTKDAERLRMLIENNMYVETPSLWPDRDDIFQPLYAKAAAIALAMSLDSAPLSPAGYAKPLSVGRGDLVLMVYHDAREFPLVREVPFDQTSPVVQVIKPIALKHQICDRIITR